MTYTLRPNGTAENSQNFAFAGAASIAAALSDDSGSSYILSTQAGGTLTELLQDVAIPANSRVQKVIAYYKAAHPTNCIVVTRIGSTIDNKWSSFASQNVTGATQTLYYGQWEQVAADGSEWDQAHLNNLQIQIASNVVGGQTPAFTEMYLDVVTQTKPSVTIVSPAAGASVTTTHRPLLKWTPTIHDGFPQKGFRIKVYDLSVQPTPDPISSSTTGLLWDTSPDSTETQILCGASLPDGHYKWFIEVAVDFNGHHWYSDWVGADFYIGVHVDPPTNVAVDSATLITDHPAFSAVSPAAPTADLATDFNTVYVEWEVAKDATFTTTPSFSHDTTPTSGTNMEHAVASQASLGIGTWYLRARCIDKYGSTSAWTSGGTFVIAHPPAAAPISPTGAQAYIYNAAGNIFDWAFSSPAASEVQTAYQLIVERNDTGALILDTGKVASTSSQVSAVIPTTAEYLVLRWKVSVWDSDDVESISPSIYSLFMLADAPAVVLSIDTADNPQPHFSWTVTESGARSQRAWVLEIVDLDDPKQPIIYSASAVNDVATFQVDDASVLQNNTNYEATLTVTDTWGLSSSDTLDFLTAWVPPDVVPFAVDASTHDSAGAVIITWDNTNNDSRWKSYRVYRRASEGPGPWDLITESFSTDPALEYDDYMAAAATDYDYVVLQVITEFGVEVEGDRLNFVTVATPPNGHYWLIYPVDSTQNILLTMVTDDAFTEEYETAEMNVAGLGRRVEYGDRFGYRGTMTAKLRNDDNRTARQKRKQVESLKALRAVIYIRTPFGDIWKVATNDLQSTRAAGTGGDEWVDLVIPYAEVF